MTELTTTMMADGGGLTELMRMSEVVIGIGFVCCGVGLLGLLWELREMRRMIVACLAAEHRIMAHYDPMWDEQARHNWNATETLIRHSEKLSVPVNGEALH